MIVALALAANGGTDPMLSSWALVGGIASPFLAVGAAILASVLSRRTGREQNQTSERAVQVDEKEAHTAEIAMIIDGFTASLNAAQQEIERKGADLDQARVELKDAVRELTEARADASDLRHRMAAYGRQLTEMIFHIISLEQMIPNPPGPPPRPEWEPWPDPHNRPQNS